MQILDQTILNSLSKPNIASHKGQNGRVLVIAGSDKYHGALLLAVRAASRIVDMVYVYSVETNLQLINNLKSEISTFISVSKEDLWKTVDLVDSVLIGPGLEESKQTKKGGRKIIKKIHRKEGSCGCYCFVACGPLLITSKLYCYASFQRV